MSVTYKISPAGFGWLAQAFANKQIISPFANFAQNSSDFDETVKTELVSQGVISEDGTIEPKALAAFNVLAQADAYSRIRILGTTAPVEKITYFYQGTACSVDSDQDGFIVTFPAMAKEAGFVLEEFVGSSRFSNVSMLTTISPKAALSLLALVDLYRKRALLSLADEAKTIPVSLNEIVEQANCNSSLMSFVTVIKKLAEVGSLTAEDILMAFGVLMEQKLVEKASGNYQLINEALELATTFLLPEYVFHLSYGRLVSASAVEHSECYVVFCGMHNLLYFEQTEDKILLETMTGSELLSILVNSLIEPPYLLEQDREVEKAAS